MDKRLRAETGRKQVDFVRVHWGHRGCMRFFRKADDESWSPKSNEKHYRYLSA